MLTEQQKILIINLPETEYGQALFAWIRDELDLLESKEEHGGKICNDPLIEDFRTQLGMRISFKRLLRLPNELIQKSKQGAKQ